MDQWIVIDADHQSPSINQIDPTRRRPRAVSREWIDATD